MEEIYNDFKEAWWLDNATNMNGYTSKHTHENPTIPKELRDPMNALQIPETWTNNVS